MAKELVEVAKKSGANAVKFQTFKAEEFISDKNQTYTYYSKDKEITESMYEMFKRYEFSKNQWKEIYNHCKNTNITFFSTPQNTSDLELLLDIFDMPIIKIGSDDLTNLKLIRYFAQKKKPIIISVGMSFISEIEDAINTIRSVENEQIIVLHCVSSYPANENELNLKKMQTISNTFDLIVGFSDHTIGNTASIAAVALGAKVIEKHFTLDKRLQGPDHWFSADALEFKVLCESIRYCERSLGSIQIIPTEKEMEMRKLSRRSIVAGQNINKGEKITEKMVAFKRPGSGLLPKFEKYICGMNALCDIKKNELITFDKLYGDR
jgi:sialic acid synthase SpsE